MKSFLYVAFGGAAGATIRYLFNLWLKPDNINGFPWHTFTINSLGCLSIGFFFALSNKFFHQNNFLNIFLVTGLLGAFTTFSTYSIEAVNLFLQQQKTTALLYILASNIVGFSLTFFGGYIAKILA